MNVNELAFDVALLFDCGDFQNIKDNGWESQKDFLRFMEKQHNIKWSVMSDGRKIMSVPKASPKESGLEIRYVVLGEWVAIYNFLALEQKLDSPTKTKQKHSCYHDDDDEWSHDDPHEYDNGLDDYNDDYGWWR